MDRSARRDCQRVWTSGIACACANSSVCRLSRPATAFRTARGPSARSASTTRLRAMSPGPMSPQVIASRFIPPGGLFQLDGDDVPFGLPDVLHLVDHRLAPARQARLAQVVLGLAAPLGAARVEVGQGNDHAPAVAVSVYDCAPMNRFYRIERLPPYVFNVVNELKTRARARGEDIIDFGMGNPDLPSPEHVVEKLVEAARKPRNYRYSASRGVTKLRHAISEWYRPPYGAAIDPDTEAIAVIGVK